MQICRYADMQICRYADMQICRYADMQICRYADAQMRRSAADSNRLLPIVASCARLLGSHTHTHT
jgi:hypothetical protein